jgi:hypothetical protein
MSFARNWRGPSFWVQNPEVLRRAELETVGIRRVIGRFSAGGGFGVLHIWRSMLGARRWMLDNAVVDAGFDG